MAFTFSKSSEVFTDVTTHYGSPGIITEGAIDWQAPAGEDLVVKMGDALAANKISFVDSNGVEVAKIDSDGVFTGGAAAFFADDTPIKLGNTIAAPNVQVLWETADANANSLLVSLPAGGGTDVPVLSIGDDTALNKDLGMFNGVTDPTLAVLSNDATKAITLSHDGTNGVINVTSGSIVLNDNWTAASKTCADLGTVTTADINGGTIDGVTIGGASAGAGTFTTVTANTSVSSASLLTASNAAALTVNIPVSGADAGVHTISLQIDSNTGLSLAATGDGAGGVGARTLTVGCGWNAAGQTCTDLGTVTTADINGGTLDGVTIGGASTAAGSFTTVTAGTSVSTPSIITADNAAALTVSIPVSGADAGVHTLSLQIDGNTGLSIAATGNGAGGVGARTLTIGCGWNAAGQTCTDIGILTTADINGGSLDGTVIGAASAAAGTFTTISGSGELDLTGVGSQIDLNPAHTTTANIIDITPSAALGATIDQVWKAINIDGSNLDPGATGDSLYGYYSDFSGVSLANDPIIESVYIAMPATYSGQSDVCALHAIGNGMSVELIDNDKGRNAVYVSSGTIRSSWTYANTAESEFSNIVVGMDITSLAASSNVHGIRFSVVGTSSGDVSAIEVGDGLDVVHHHPGTFATPSQTEYAARVPAAGAWTDGIDGNQIFVADNDEIYIGNAAKFDALEVILTTVSTQDVRAEYYFYDTALSWIQFFPIDTTNGFKTNGNISWDADNLVNWKSDYDPGGADGSAGYYIKVKRTRNIIVTPPTPTTIKLKVSSDYIWDKDGDLNIRDLKVGGGFALARTACTGDIAAGAVVTRYSYIGWDRGGADTITISSEDIAVEGRIFIIKDEVGGVANDLTIATEGAETIDGQATYTLSTERGCVWIFSDGSNLHIIAEF